MSMSCLTCTATDCPDTGLDKAACEDHDCEPHEESCDPVARQIAELRAGLENLSEQFSCFREEWDGVWAAVVRAREAQD
jgi:hypothetical protein